MNLNLPKESRTFTGGMIKDVIASKIPKNQYVEALNMQITAPEVEKLGGSKVSIGNEQVIDLSTGYDPERKAYRITLNNSSASIAHDFDWNGVAGTTVISANVTPSLRYADLVAQVIASAAGQGVTITVTTVSPIAGTAAVIHLGISSDTDFTVAEEITSVNTPVYIIHEFYTTGFGIAFNLLKSFNIGEDLYLISSNGEVFRLGVAKKNATTGVWTYTVILETATIIIDEEAVVDLDGEINFKTRISLYFSGLGITPRALYVIHEDVWQDQYSFIYTEAAQYIEAGNPNGFYTHESVFEQTKLQIIRNFANLSLASVNESGGQLQTGGYYYAIRQLSGNEISTGFSIFSDLVGIFSNPLTDVYLSGDNAGILTGKSVTFNVSGLDDSVYDNYEVGVLQNTNGVFTASSIGIFPITSSSSSFTHTGFESATSLTLSEIATQQIVIKDSKNLVINRNRLFLSNITYKIDDDLSIACKTAITITTERTSLPACGKVVPASVGEYMVPDNVYNRAGYMLNDTYRIGAMFRLTSGFLTSPYTIGDHTFIFADGSLTNNPVGNTPTLIYVFNPSITIDLTDPIWPDIDGVPFAEAVEYVYYVRMPCNPQIKETGYVMPRSNSYNGAYNVGREIAEAIPYIAGPTDTDRTQLGFLSPDILFTDRAAFTSVDKFFIYGNPGIYNHIFQTVGPVTSTLNELNGDFQNPYIEVDINATQLLPFNSVGTTDIGGLVYRTTVTLPIDLGGNNQKSVGVGLINSTYATSASGHGDYGFYYAQHYSPISDPYGAENSGSYISTGHSRRILGASIYTDSVYGGDTFTQKNFTKLMNRDEHAATVDRTGLSYYTQNRINTQMRYFTGLESELNYPYQTQSETQWLINELDEGTLLYSESYTPNHSFEPFLAYNPDAPTNDKGSNFTYYSLPKILEGPNDSYRIILPFNYKAYSAIYGEINNTFRYKNFLVILMDTAVLLQELDQQVTVSTASGQPIQVGDGSVMGAREDPISYYGNQIKTAACMYLHEGQIYIGWYDKYHNKIIRRGIDGVKDLGETNYIQSFLNANNQYVGDEWSMVMGYDDLTKEFLVSTNATIPDSTQWDDVATFLTGDITYTGIDSHSTQYWKARRAVPADIDPRDPANQLQYWELYYNSNYTLAFNEKENQWSGLYSYKTRQFVPYKNTFLTWYFSNSGDNPLSELYEHNRGEILNWYGIDFLAYLKVKFNDVPDLFKESRVLWLRSDNQPYYLHVRGNVRGKTYGIQDDFKQLRDFWSISPKNDATYDMPVLPRGTNTTGINTLCTGPVRGETIEITVFFDDENFVSEMIHTYLPKRRYP